MNRKPGPSAAEPVQSPRQISAPSFKIILVSDTLLLFIQLYAVLALFLPSIRAGYVDFRPMYTTGLMVRTGHGHQIYDAGAQKMFQDGLVSKNDSLMPCIRPAYQALFYVPFTFLPYHQAYFAFLAFNLGILLLCLQLLRPYMSNMVRIRYYLPAFLLLFFPITIALMQGQDSIILLGLLIGALICIQRHNDYAAGVLVALGLIKFELVLPIFLLFLAWRRWRFSAAFACTSTVLMGISIWIAGLAQTVSYLHNMVGVGSTLGFNAGPPVNMKLMANLHGALYGVMGGSPYTLPLTIAASAAIMILLACRRPHGINLLVIAIPASTLVSYYMYVHDLCILIIPLAIMFNRQIEDWKTKSLSERMRITATVLMFVAPTCLIFATHYYWIVSFPLLAFTIITFVSLSTDRARLISEES